MKLFGEFLVEKGKITKEQLLTSLVQQIKDMPTIYEIVLEMKILSVDEILTTISTQARENSGFFDTLKKNSLWSDDKKDILDKKISSIKTPLGKILIQNKYIDAKELSALLDEFLDDVKLEEVSVGSSSPNLGKNELMINLLESFTENKKNEIDNVIGFLDNWTDLNGADKESMILSMIDTMHFLKGAARNAETSISEKIFSALEKYLREVLDQKSTYTADKILLLQKFLSEVWSLCWDIRNSIDREKNELPVSNSDLKNKYEIVFEKLNQTLASE